MRPGATSARWRRAALVAGIPGLALAAVVAFLAAALLLVSIGNGAVLGARDTVSRTAATDAGISDTDLAVYQRAAAAAGVPWQLLAALAQAQQRARSGTDGQGPFRISPGMVGITADDAGDLPNAAGFIAGHLDRALTGQGVAGGADLMTIRAALGRDGRSKPPRSVTARLIQPHPARVEWLLH